MTSKFVRPWRISLLLPGRKRQPYMEGYYSPSLRRAWGVQSKRVISRTIFYGILNSSWFSSEIGVASVSSSQPSLTTMEVSLEEALALKRKGLLEVSYRFPNDPAAAAAETFEAHPFTPPEEHPESYYRRQIPKIVGGKIVVMDDKDTQSYIQTVLPSGSEAWFVKNTAGVLNHKEFLWRQYPKITTWGEEPYRPYDPRQNHPDFPPYKGGRYDDYDLRKAETFYGEITTEPMTVYRRMGWKQYYDGLEMGYLHPMKTRMQLRPDENIGGTWATSNMGGTKTHIQFAFEAFEWK